jgi:hypothetical protein
MRKLRKRSFAKWQACAGECRSVCTSGVCNSISILALSRSVRKTLAKVCLDCDVGLEIKFHRLQLGQKGKQVGRGLPCCRARGRQTCPSPKY